MTHTIWFDHLRLTDLALVGGKNAALGGAVYVADALPNSLFCAP